MAESRSNASHPDGTHDPYPSGGSPPRSSLLASLLLLLAAPTVGHRLVRRPERPLPGLRRHPLRQRVGLSEQPLQYPVEIVVGHCVAEAPAGLDADVIEHTFDTMTGSAYSTTFSATGEETVDRSDHSPPRRDLRRSRLSGPTSAGPPEGEVHTAHQPGGPVPLRVRATFATPRALDRATVDSAPPLATSRRPRDFAPRARPRARSRPGHPRHRAPAIAGAIYRRAARCGSSRSYDVGFVDIEIVFGDITRQSVDAVVNAANSSLLGGGGVDGAIHRRGGPAILAECRELRAGHYGKGLPTGQAVATTAGELDARWVIHTVGPATPEEEDRSELLASCYRESLRVADELGARTRRLPCRLRGHLRLADGRRRPHRRGDRPGDADDRCRGGPFRALRRRRPPRLPGRCDRQPAARRPLLGQPQRRHSRVLHRRGEEVVEHLHPVERQRVLAPAPPSARLS